MPPVAGSAAVGFVPGVAIGGGVAIGAGATMATFALGNLFGHPNALNPVSSTSGTSSSSAREHIRIARDFGMLVLNTNLGVLGEDPEAAMIARVQASLLVRQAEVSLGVLDRAVPQRAAAKAFGVMDPMIDSSLQSFVSLVELRLLELMESERGSQAVEHGVPFGRQVSAGYLRQALATEGVTGFQVDAFVESLDRELAVVGVPSIDRVSYGRMMAMGATLRDQPSISRTRQVHTGLSSLRS